MAKFSAKKIVVCYDYIEKVCISCVIVCIGCTLFLKLGLIEYKFENHKIKRLDYQA